VSEYQYYEFQAVDRPVTEKKCASYENRDGLGRRRTRLLSALIPLRDDSASGDHRALYLAWLLSARQGVLPDDDTEPPLPPRLRKLNAPLKAVSDVLRIK
jgi:hypothetical protein